MEDRGEEQRQEEEAEARAKTVGGKKTETQNWRKLGWLHRREPSENNLSPSLVMSSHRWTATGGGWSTGRSLRNVPVQWLR